MTGSGGQEIAENQKVDVIVVGQGLAGSAVAWRLIWAGKTVKVIDADKSETASKISAGLMTPYSGQRIVKLEGFDDLSREASEFYERVSQVTRRELISEVSTVRWFSGQQEERDFLRRKVDQRDGTELTRDGEGGRTGIRMLGAKRLNVTAYLKGTKEHLTENDEWLAAQLRFPEDISIGKETVQIPKLGLEGHSIVFCQGFQGRENPWFPDIPNAAAKGEILTIGVPTAERWSVQHMTHWMAELQDEKGEQCIAEARYVVGATYDREQLDGEVTQCGYEELAKATSEITKQPYRVIHQKAAVRAGMKNRRYVVKRHATVNNMYVVNGMGSRGSLLAPTAAKELLTVLEQPPSKMKPTQPRKSLTELAQKIVRRVVKPGDRVVDATAGNGHDTQFLAETVGEGGTVIAIDIQASALASTKERLADSGVKAAIIAELGSHDIVLERLVDAKQPVAAVMMNLGYLPRSDKAITTTASSTCAALCAAVRLVRPGGVITVVAYRGHHGGQDEAEAVRTYGLSLSPAEFSVDIVESDETNSSSPVLMVLRRIRK